ELECLQSIKEHLAIFLAEAIVSWFFLQVFLNKEQEEVARINNQYKFKVIVIKNKNFLFFPASPIVYNFKTALS
ncbi:MAG: hypothetical protein ACE5Q7_05410, partial [Candidatus Nitrosomaritimum yanchengensis]